MFSTRHGVLGGDRRRDVLRRSVILAIISFLTLIDLFGGQALLPKLVEAYDTDIATMGLAVNASTFGMALSGLVVAWFADRIDRKRGIWISLVLLSIPTALLGIVDNVWLFLSLRVVQGIFMAAAFMLTMTYLSEQCDVTAAGGAMAAYITGNVAANLFGRMLAVSIADHSGLSGSFFAFAVLNLLGAVFAFTMIGARDREAPMRKGSPLQAWRAHLANRSLRTAFAMGFAILYVFVGIFTYVNVHLTENLNIPDHQIALVYLVFLPALVTTPFAASAVSRYGPQAVFQISGVLALAGVALTFIPSLGAVLTGLAVIGTGTFFMQAAATGFVGRTAKGDRAAANGLYLTSYYLGGLVGAFTLGQAHLAGGWFLVAGINAVFLLAMLPLARALHDPQQQQVPQQQPTRDGQSTKPDTP